MADKSVELTPVVEAPVVFSLPYFEFWSVPGVMKMRADY